MNGMNLFYREEVRITDAPAVRAIVKSSGYFSDEEVSIAVELVEERLCKGEKSGYFFVFAEQGACLAGYSCFGPIPGSRYGYDLYWIAVDEKLRNLGIGKELLLRSEAIILDRGGRKIYIETSSRSLYSDTLAFYGRCGYKSEACLDDFYAPGDGKIILSKMLYEK